MNIWKEREEDAEEKAAWKEIKPWEEAPRSEDRGCYRIRWETVFEYPFEGDKYEI